MKGRELRLSCSWDEKLSCGRTGGVVEGIPHRENDMRIEDVVELVMPRRLLLLGCCSGPSISSWECLALFVRHDCLKQPDSGRFGVVAGEHL